MALHDTVAVPDPVMLLGEIAPQVKPDGAESVSDTVPVKWLTEVIVTVEDADDPALTGEGDVAVIVKPTTWTLTVIVCVRLPLVLVMVAV